MKATLEIPDELYRSVKARSALEGRPVRAVATELFEKWLAGEIETTAKSPKPAAIPVEAAKAYLAEDRGEISHRGGEPGNGGHP